MTSLKNINNPKRFLKIFKAEIDNRAVALEVMKNFREITLGKPESEFWHQYYQLELLNQQMYAPYAQKFGGSLSAPKMTKTLLKLLYLSKRVAPTTILKLISNSTNKYVADLKEMHALSTEEDKAFFQFVVDQEEIQAQGMMLLRDGKTEAAAKHIQDFVDQHRQQQAA